MKKVINVSYVVPEDMSWSDLNSEIILPEGVSVEDFRIINAEDEFDYDDYLLYVTNFVQNVSYPRTKSNGVELREDDLVSPFTYEEWVMLGKPKWHVNGISTDKKVLKVESMLYLTAREASNIADGIAAGRFTLS